MQPVKLIPADQAPVQPAYNTKVRRGKATQHTAAVAWQQEGRGPGRQLTQAGSTCTAAVSNATFGDINYACRFTFVQVGGSCLISSLLIMTAVVLLVPACLQQHCA